MSLLEAANVSVRFGGLHALDGVSLEVEAGHVTGLIGPNGAGKTTLFNVITGLQPPHAGRISLDGRDITAAKPHRRARLGIGRTFQRLETFGTLSTRDNVLVAAEMRRGWSHDRGDGAEDDVDRIIDRVGLREVAGERVDQLPTGMARLVELARALASRPRVLLLDEPSSGLNEAETATLGRLLQELAGSGLGVLLVEHDMSFVMGTCAHIHVLDFGRVIAIGPPAAIQADPAVRTAYLGAGDEAEPSSAAPAAERAPAPDDPPVAITTIIEDQLAPQAANQSDPAAAALALRSVTAAYGSIEVLSGVDLTVKPGQVYALLGPNGAGKSTTLRVASGQLPPTGGEVWFAGEKVTGAPPDRLARGGMCLVPEGRGIFPNLTVVENLRMATYTGTPFRDVLERAYERFPRLEERSKQVAGTLSGGEQQMLSMARAMAVDPKVLLLDELSMGLAPLIVEDLYEVVARIAAESVSILVVEQFAHEVLDVAEVAAIMLNGRIDYVGSPREIGDQLDAAYLGLAQS
ncbi:MAG TPA: ATP-binding cassette domain-containing protein [Acidimicrobiia bacterium]